MNVSNKIKYIVFPEDTYILYPNREFKNVENTVIEECDKIHGWLLNSNKLSIN